MCGKLIFQEHDLAFEENSKGIQITQHGKSYLARKWKLTERVISIIKIAHKAGLCCHWQKGHPRGNESNHISFSSSHEKKWVFVLGKEAKPPKVECITFNKAYRKFVDARKAPWTWELGGGENILISPDDLEELLRNLDEYL